MAKAEAVEDWLGWWSRAKDMRNPELAPGLFFLDISLTKNLLTQTQKFSIMYV